MVTKMMIPKLTKIIFVVASIALIMPSYAADSSEITVLTGSQTADGMTQDDLNMEMLAAIELTTKNKLKEKMVDVMIADGIKQPKFEVNASSVYVTVQGLKLAVVKLKIENTNQVFIYGIKGDELLRVGCLSLTKKTIPISYGKCGEAIKKVYGVDISKGSY